jgi:hypothetical protein
VKVHAGGREPVLADRFGGRYSWSMVHGGRRYRAGPEEPSVGRSAADTAAAFLGATATRGIEADPRGRWKRHPRHGCSDTRARWSGALAETMASRVRRVVEQRHR